LLGDIGKRRRLQHAIAPVATGPSEDKALAHSRPANYPMAARRDFG
jgi:hypothetical protein